MSQVYPARQQLDAASWYQPQAALLELLERDRLARHNAYIHAPHDVEEHLGIEASISQGGYATRQIHELIQNGADAIFRQDQEHGWLEVCLTKTHLYVANTGSPLDALGLRTLLQAHVSRKRSGEIGRFGLGFKAVLKVTQRPQIFSRSICVGFDAQRTLETLRQSLPELERAPSLRMAWPLALEQQDDPILAQLLTWATTVVRLPLHDELALLTLKRELHTFDAAFLLFTPTSLALTLRDLSDEVPYVRNLQKQRGPLTELGPSWLVVEDEQHEHAQPWVLLSTTLEINDQAALLDAGERHRRQEYALHWAMPWSSDADHQETGRLWVFSPLEEFVAIPGIINAPWKVSDDRRHILPGAFNEALIQKASAFILAQYARCAQSVSDPGRVLELMPAQTPGLGWAGERLKLHLDAGLKSLAAFPDTRGSLRRLGELRLHPRELPTALIHAWSELVERPGMMPHISCYANARRRLSLEGLAQEDAFRGLIPWLEAARSAGRRGALSFLRLAYKALKAHRDEVRSARLVPTTSDTFCALDDPSLFFGSPDGFDEGLGLEFVHPEVLARPELEEFLVQIGRLHRPQHQDIIHAATAQQLKRLKRKADAEVWRWLKRAPLEIAIGVASALFERALAGQSPFLRAPTLGHELAPPQLAYLEPSPDPGLHAWAIDPALEVDAQLLSAAGFSCQFIMSSPAPLPADLLGVTPAPQGSPQGQIWPLGPLLDRPTKPTDALIQVTELALEHHVALDPVLLSEVVARGALRIAQRPVWLTDYPSSWPVSWGALGFELSPQLAALSSGVERSADDARAALKRLPSALWDALHERALEHDEDAPRRAFYVDCFELGFVPRRLRLFDDVLAVTSLMVTGDEALAARGASFGWHALCLDRGARLNAMKAGARLLTGVPQLEAGQRCFEGTLSTLASELCPHLTQPQHAALSAVEILGYTQIQEVLVSTRGRQERQVESIWQDRRLHLSVGPDRGWAAVRMRLIEALCEHELIDEPRAERLMEIFAPLTHDDAQASQLGRLLRLDGEQIEAAFLAWLGLGAWPQRWLDAGGSVDAAALLRALGPECASPISQALRLEVDAQEALSALGLSYAAAGSARRAAPEPLSRWAHDALARQGRHCWPLGLGAPWRAALAQGAAPASQGRTLWLTSSSAERDDVAYVLRQRGFAVAVLSAQASLDACGPDPAQATFLCASLELIGQGLAQGRFDAQLGQISRVIVEGMAATLEPWRPRLLSSAALRDADWCVFEGHAPQPQLPQEEAPDQEDAPQGWPALGFTMMDAPVVPQRLEALPQESAEQALLEHGALVLVRDQHRAAQLVATLAKRGLNAALRYDAAHPFEDAQPLILVTSLLPQQLGALPESCALLAVEASVQPAASASPQHQALWRWAGEHPWRAWFELGALS